MRPRRYRKRPVVVDVMGPLTVENCEGIAEWCGGELEAVRPFILIDTLEGRKMLADLGDYIIRGVVGEFYPCKPDIFAMTYEPTVGA